MLKELSIMHSVLTWTFLALLACAGLVAPAVADDPEFIIGFPEDNLSNDWRAAQMREIREELAKHPNVTFLTADARGSVARNIADIEQLANAGAQLLFLAPRDPDAVQMVVSRLRDKGMHIVLLTRKLNTDDYDTYIGPDDFKIGYDAALFLAQRLGGTGRILILQGVPTTSTAILRNDGFIAGLRKYPNIEVIEKSADYARAKAVQVVEDAFREGLQFDAIYAHNDAMAIGARTVIKQRGINPASIPMVSIDYLPETRQAILNGEQLASFTYPTCGKAGVAAALDILHGIKVPRYISIPSQMVTRDNADKITPVY